VTHPLDPLAADEFSTVAGILLDEHGTVPARRATVVGLVRHLA
jgi:hypothetical protein